MRYFVFVTILLLASCRTPRTASTTPTPQPNKTSVFECIAAQAMHPEWLSCSALIDFENDGFSIKVNANIRYRRDSVIWMNVSKMGFEVARVLITTDSVYVLNQLDKTCTIRGLDYLRETVGLPTNFKNLENLLLGAPVWLGETANMESQQDSTGGWLIRHNGGKSGRSATYQTDPQCRLIAMKFKEYAYKDDFVQELSSFGTANFSNFPSVRDINAVTPKNGAVSVGIVFSALEVDIPKAIRFDIPGHFKRQ